MSEVTRKKIPTLSKSRFLAGLQCNKRLYFECFRRDLADIMGSAKQAMFDAGAQVGQVARGIYPGGVLIGYDHFHHNDAVASTGTVLNNSSIPAIYEAGFEYDKVRTRVDILARAGDGVFDLVEVKSNTKVSEEHLPDVGIQLYVLTGCGLETRRVCIAHLNRDYVYPGGDYDLSRLFTEEDVSENVLQLQSDIPRALQAMRLALASSDPPEIQVGRHCSKPYTCPFYDHCHSDEPQHHVSQLPRASDKLLMSLEEAGIDDIRDIPKGFQGLNALQQRVRDCVVNGQVHLNTHLREELERLEYPIHFLDFETFNPPLPLYLGTHPYDVIPFQWSVHTTDRDHNLRHDEFLHDGLDDPREMLARSLLQTLGTSGSIVAYSGFEEARIRELANALPQLSRDLLALLGRRLVDLLPLVRANCYHPEFHGSFSLKSVLPAIVPDLGYNDLEIQDGALASVAYAEMIQPHTQPERRKLLRKNLLEYCKRDTEAMVRMFDVLSSGRCGEC